MSGEMALGLRSSLTTSRDSSPTAASRDPELARAGVRHRGRSRTFRSHDWRLSRRAQRLRWAGSKA